MTKRQILTSLAVMTLLLELGRAAPYGTITLGKNKALFSICEQRISLRDMRDFVNDGFEHNYETDFWHPFLSLAYGIMNRVACNIEVSYFPYVNTYYPQRRYTNYTLGLGVKTHIVQEQPICLCAVAEWRHDINIDRSTYYHHKYYQQRLAGLVFGHQWSHEKWILEAHVGPCYLYHRSEDYFEGGSYATVFLETGSPFGCFGGLETMILEHISIEGDAFITKGLGAFFSVGYKF